MQKSNFKLVLAMVTVLLVTFASCGKKMDPLRSNAFTVNPSPMELIGSKVPVTINGKIPQNWFDKNAVVRITPVIFHAGGETVGKTFVFQGENVRGNGITINKALGGNITMQEAFPYTPAMKQSELYLRFNVEIKGKRLRFPELKVADGVVSTESLASATSTNASIAPDAFQKILKETHEADIMFLIQQAELRSSQLNSGDVRAWQQLVKDADKNSKMNVDVEISSYASPDGGYELNKKLAEKREANTNSYLSNQFKKENINPEINARYTAQDWEGFKRLVEASNLQDKNSILRVISLYQDPADREREIKNISYIYSELAETILPRLRRSRLIANIEIVGKSDKEIVSAVRSKKYKDLNVEELLYAATLNGVDPEVVYKEVIATYPNDYRGYNNLGVTLFNQGKMAEAIKYFDKAASMNPNSPDVKANLGLIALANNDIQKAQNLLGNASSATSLPEILGLLYIKEGDYRKAQDSFGDIKSNNAAIAQLLNKDYNKAQRTLQSIPNKDATTYYISAIVAARTNNTSGVVSNLKQAMQNGIPLASITSDVEFSRYLSNNEVIRQLGR